MECFRKQHKGTPCHNGAATLGSGFMEAHNLSELSHTLCELTMLVKYVKKQESQEEKG